jgi:hypothetical protein
LFSKKKKEISAYFAEKSLILSRRIRRENTMQTVQADDFAASHNLKLTRDANGVLVAEFHSNGRPFIMSPQAHTEFVDSDIKAEAPAPSALLQNSQPQDHRDDHPDVPCSGNGYPTVQQIAETVAAAVTAALCKVQSGQDRGHFSLTQLDHPSEPSPVYQSADDPVDRHAIGTSTLSAVQFKLPFPLPTQPGVAPENQSSVDVDSGEGGYLYLALQRALYSEAKVGGLYSYDPDKEQIPKYDRAAMPKPKSNAVPLTVLPDNVGSLLASPTGSGPPTSTQLAATTERETSPSVLQSVIRYWDTYRADLCLGASLVILLLVIVRSFR